MVDSMHLFHPQAAAGRKMLPPTNREQLVIQDQKLTNGRVLPGPLTNCDGIVWSRAALSAYVSRQ